MSDHTNRSTSPPSAADARWRGSVAHELNNVLGVIRGNTDLILEAPGDRRLVSTCAQDILAACEALTQLSWRLQVTGGRVLLHPRPVELSAWVRELHTRAGHMDLGPVDIHLAPGCPTTAELDGTQLGTAILHLIADSRLCGASKARVQIGGSAHHIDILVEDDRRHPPHLSGLRTELTLAAVQSIVRDMAGQATLQQPDPLRSQVRIRLPVAGRPDPLPEVIVSGPPRRVLIVDDEESVGRTVARLLDRAGCHVETYTDPIEALERVRTDPDAFDLALVDVMMPLLTGPELLAALRRFGIRLPVVFMTGAAPAETEVLDARAVLSKPFSKSQLLEALSLEETGKPLTA